MARGWAVDGERLLRGALLAALAAMLDLLLDTGRIRHYVNPAYVRLMVPAAWALVLLAAVQVAGAVRRAAGPEPDTKHAHDHGHDDAVSPWAYLLFAGTFVLGVTLAPATFGAELAQRRGFNPVPRVATAEVLRPGAGPGAFVAWLASGWEGLRRGSYAAARPAVPVGATERGAAQVESGPSVTAAEEAADAAPPAADPRVPTGSRAGATPAGRQVVAAAPAEVAGSTGAGAEKAPEPAPASRSGSGLAAGSEEGLGTAVAQAVPAEPARAGAAVASPGAGRLVIDERNFFEVMTQLWWEPQRFAGREAELLGFVVRFPELGRERVMVARLLVTCHVAHAMPHGLVARLPGGEDLAEDTWVRVVGVLGVGDVEGTRVPVLEVTYWEQVPPLRDPYVFP